MNLVQCASVLSQKILSLDADAEEKSLSYDAIGLGEAEYLTLYLWRVSLSPDFVGPLDMLAHIPLVQLPDSEGIRLVFST